MNWLWVKAVDLFEAVDVADAENFGYIAAVANAVEELVGVAHDEGSDVDVVYVEDDDYYQWNQQVMFVEVCECLKNNSEC